MASTLTTQEFGLYLRDLRKKAGLTIRQLEEKSGVSNAYISQMENGKRGVPSLEIIEKLSPHLSVSSEELSKKAGYLHKNLRNQIVHNKLDIIKNTTEFPKLLNSSIDHMISHIFRARKQLNELEQQIETSLINFIKACNQDYIFIEEVNSLFDVLTHGLLKELTQDEKIIIMPMVYQLYEGIEASNNKDDQLRNTLKVEGELQKIPIISELNVHVSLEKQDTVGYTVMMKKPLENNEYFYLVVPNDCMIYSGIRKGYRVLVRKQNHVDSGKIGVVSINDEQITLKRIYYQNNKVILQSENTSEMPLFLDIYEVKIMGQVVKVEFDV